MTLRIQIWASLAEKINSSVFSFQNKMEEKLTAVIATRVYF